MLSELEHLRGLNKKLLQELRKLAESEWAFEECIGHGTINAHNTSYA